MGWTLRTEDAQCAEYGEGRAEEEETTRGDQGPCRVWGPASAGPNSSPAVDSPVWTCRPERPPGASGPPVEPRSGWGPAKGFTFAERLLRRGVLILGTP